MNIEKLNWRERNKLELSPYEYLQNIENLHFDLLNDSDRNYLQDGGIYNHEAEDEIFTLRLRFNAGRISPEQLLLIAKIAKRYDLEIVLTVRAQMQLHGLDADTVLSVWKELNENGISTWQTFGDNVRNIVTDVYDGRGIYSEIEVYPFVKQMQEYILKKPKYVGMLPRRFSVAISGNRANLNSFFSNDVFFALAQKDDLKGFNVYLGGKNSELAKDANVFLKPNQVVEYFIALLEAFYLYGSRGTRGKTRLFHWVQKEGLQNVKEQIDNEHTLSYDTAGELLLKSYDKTIPVHLKDNSFVYVYYTDFARINADTFVKLWEFAREHRAEVRLGVDQHIYFLGLKSEVTPFESSYLASTISSCVGAKHCIFSFWNIKEDGNYLPLKDIQKNKITLGFSGCTKGCAKHQHCDIGLLGMHTSIYGFHQEAAKIYLGAEYTLGLSLARALCIIVPKKALKGFVKIIIEEFEQSIYEEFELFSAEVLNKYSTDFLSLWFLAKLSTQEDVSFQKNIKSLEKVQLQDEKEILNRYFGDIIPTQEFDYTREIRKISQNLWKV